MKTVLVTGASGDIGKAIVKAYCNANYRVIGTYHNDEASIKELKNSLGDNFHYFRCDFSDLIQYAKLIDNIHSLGFTIDILVNNAGISVVGMLQDLDNKTWNDLWHINVSSIVFLSKYVITDMLRAGSGKIINISSVWGQHGASCEVAYSTTKGAIDTFTKALAKELAPSNIQVNAISCGIIDTKMNGHLLKEDLEDIISEIPASRLGTPEDVANAVISVSNMGSYMTGQIITIDGGWQI